MAFRTSPGKMGSVQHVSECQAGAFPLSLAWVSRRVGEVWASAGLYALDE